MKSSLIERDGLCLKLSMAIPHESIPMQRWTCVWLADKGMFELRIE
jgi:hypothetical protein